MIFPEDRGKSDDEDQEEEVVVVVVEAVASSPVTVEVVTSRVVQIGIRGKIV